MPKVAFTETWNGLTNQPPIRTQPGQIKDVLNLRLSIAKGATTRNGTDLVRWLSELPSDLETDEVVFFSYKGDLIAVYDGAIKAFNLETGVEVPINDLTGGFPYLAGIDKGSTRVAAWGNSIVVLNRNTTTATLSSASYSVTGTVDDFSLLPSAPVGVYYKCSFNDGTIPAGYYQRFSNNGVLDWRRVAAPGQPNALLDGATLPHFLLKLEDGTYEFDEIDWTPRRSGDDETNPAPSWAGESLNAVAFHAGRLFLISAGAITATSSDDRYLLFLNDIDQPTDPSNPIDHDISNSAFGEPLYSQTVGNDLFIACEKGQIAFTSGQEQLNSVNGNDVALADHKTAEVFPAFAGPSVVMLDSFNAAREFVVNDRGFLSEGSDLQSHALKIFQGYQIVQVFRFEGTTFFPTVKTNTPSDGQVTFVHEKATDQGNLIQTGWTKFDFNRQINNSFQLFFMTAEQGTVKLILKHATNGFVLLNYVHGEEEAPSVIDPYNGDFAVAPCLDLRETVAGVYNQATNRTRFTYASDGNNRIRIAVPGDQQQELLPIVFNETYVEVRGKVEQECLVGVLYYDFMDLTELYPGASTVRPTISTMTVFYTDTAWFDVLVRRRGNSGTQTQREYRFKTNYLGSDLITAEAFETSFKTFNVMQDGRNTFIRIEHQGTLPMTISAIEFDVRFSDRGAR